MADEEKSSSSIDSETTSSVIDQYHELLREYGRQVGWSTGHLLNLADELKLARKKNKDLELKIQDLEYELSHRNKTAMAG